jgi:hypothetical protein
MRKLLILLILTCCFNSLFAQWPAEYKTRDSLIDKGIYTLHQRKVDTIAVYSLFGNLIYLSNYRSDYFPNYDPNKYDLCSSQETFMVFILWKKNGKSFFTFKTKCYNYPDKPLQDNGLWRYYFTHSLAIRDSKPKEVLLKRVNLQTEQITFEKEKARYQEREDIQFIVLTKSEKSTKKFGYRLYAQFGNRGDQNVNYDYNKNLPDKQMQLKLEVLCRPMVNIKELTLASKTN